MAKNAYTFAKRSKELAKKKKKEDKLARKSQRPDTEEGPYFDEATGEIVYPEAAAAEDGEATEAEDASDTPPQSPDAAERP